MSRRSVMVAVVAALAGGCRAGAGGDRDGGPVRADAGRAEVTLGQDAAVALGCWASPSPPPNDPWIQLPTDDVPPSLRQGLSFSASPDTVYLVAGARPRLYRSQDGGRTFCPVAVPAAAVEAIYAAAAFPDVLYVRTSDDPPRAFALLRSVDGGASWSRLAHDGLTLGSVPWQLVVHPGRPGVLLARQEGDLLEEPHPLMRSDDGGLSWAPFGAALSALGVPGIPAFDPDGKVVHVSVFVAPGKTLLAWSDDEGGTWHSSDGALTSAMAPGELRAPLVDKAGTVYLFDSTLLRSRDRGASWASITGYAKGESYLGASFVHRGLATLDPDGAGRLYIYRRADGAPPELARTRDGGDSWSWTPVREPPPAPLTSRSEQPSPFLFGAAGGSRLYLAGEGALLRSTDGGEGVETVKRLMRGQHVSGWPGRPDWVLTGEGREALLSQDAGRSWSPLPLPPGTVASSLAGSPDEPDTVFVIATGGLSRSRDGGRTWRGLTTEEPVRRLSVGPGGRLFAVMDARVLRSDDGGETWLPAVSPCYDARVAVAPSRPSTVYALCWLSSALMASEDGGVSWSLRWKSPSLFTGTELSLAVHPTRPEQLFLGAGSGGSSGPSLFSSDDGGRDWAALGQRQGVVTGLLVHPADPRVLYAVWDGVLARSSDGGASWLDLAVAPLTLATDPRDARVIYAGTASGLLVTRTGGAAPLSAGGP